MFKHSSVAGGKAATGNDEGFAEAAELFKVLGDETRLRILDALSGGEMRVQEIADRLAMTQSAISHQLHTLKDHRVVKARRDGRGIYYSIDDAHVKGLYEQGMEHVGHP
jgi:ArsR family transcriptional regulator, lead/cadmium/zinc/bismuth-responsive transcriptional repressor